MAMRAPIGMPAMSKRSKRVMTTLVGLVVLAIIWFQFVGIWVNWEWFKEVGYGQVFTTQAVTRILLFAVGALGVGAVVFFSLLAAYRSRPVFVPTGDVDPLSPYRTVVSTRPRVFALAISILVGLICGFSAQGDWKIVQLWIHAQPFGTTDPQFGHDVGFYVFTLPGLEMVLGWLFVLVALSFFAVLVTQYLYGGLRLSGPGRRITSQAALQLSLLVGVFVLIKAVQYWFDRYALLFSNRSSLFTGASYTDVNAVLPAKIILMVIAVICAVGFIVGAFLRSVKLPGIALALLVLSSVLIGGVWPLVLQQVVVNPNRISKEPPYISRNIAATRSAYGIGSQNVTYMPYTPASSDDPTKLVADKDTVPFARLLDPNVISPAFTQAKQGANIYGFPSQLSVDRYPTAANGQNQDYIVAARELVAANLTGDQTNWINQHVVYTHGNGLVAAPANQVNQGLPAFTVSDLTTKGDIRVDQPRIYYGSMAPNYAIVGAQNSSSAREFDTESQKYTYAGLGGVQIGNLFQRLVFATHYGEANFLFSSEINDNSKIMYNRDPRQRVELAAPFLTTDTKPYPAAVGGRVVWIVDAYTTVQNYPYAQNVTLSKATTNSLTSRSGAVQTDTDISYIRNSVKATVDAYDGTVTLYESGANDPVLKAWEGVFPGLIKPAESVTPELRAHFRYPEDLFEIQRSLLVKYHVDNPVDFSQSSGFYNVPDDPTVADSAGQPPYYLQVKLPGATKADFELTSVLTAFERQFMNAYVSASSDPANYGRITVLTLPTNPQTPGPAQIQALFRSTSEVSSAVLNATNAGGSQVTFGNLLTLPVNGGLLYVEPFYIKSQSTSSVPALNYVLVWYAGQVGVGPTLAEALARAVPKTAPTDVPNGTGTSTPQSNTTAGPTGTGPLPVDQKAAGAALQVASDDLEKARTAGDLGAIGAATQKLQEAVKNYLKFVAPAPSGSSTPTPTEGTSRSGG